jgi:hypothetical protein
LDDGATNEFNMVLLRRNDIWCAPADGVISRCKFPVALSSNLLPVTPLGRCRELPHGRSPTPDQYGKAIADETEKWGRVIRAAGIKVQ